MSYPTRPKEIHLAGMVGTGQIRFLAVIPHGKGTREVAVDVPPDLILRLADALRATRGSACDTAHSRIADPTADGYHVGHAVWHVERADQPMPCIDHSKVIEMGSLPAARKPDLIDAIKAGERGVAERKASDAAFVASQAEDRQRAYDIALYALRGIRLSSKNAPDGHPFAYFAEETRSWWAITPDAMTRLADMLAAKPEVIATWAETDTTAVELAHALSRRLSREHGE